MSEERGSDNPQVTTEVPLRYHRAPESPALRGPGQSTGSPEPCLLPCLLRCRDRAQIHVWSWPVTPFCFQSRWTGSCHDTKDICHHVWPLCVEIGRQECGFHAAGMDLLVHGQGSLDGNPPTGLKECRNLFPKLLAVDSLC